MRGEQHRRLTSIAVRALLNEERSPTLSALRRGADLIIYASSLPDRFPELGGDGYTSREPHHLVPSSAVLARLSRARRALLEGKLGDEELVGLAYAIHYLQDRCIPSLSRGLSHDLIESFLAERLDEVLDYCDTPLEGVQGYGELRRLVERQRPASNPVTAACCALRMTYAALYAVFANPVHPPRDLVESAESFRRAVWSWAGSAYAMLSTAGLLLCALQALRHASSPNPLLAAPLALPAATFTLAILAAFAKRAATLLERFRRVTSAKLFAASLAALLAPPTPAGIACAAILALVFAAPLLSRGFRRAREEAEWYRWGQ